MTEVQLADPVLLRDPAETIRGLLGRVSPDGPEGQVIIAHLVDPTLPAAELAERTATSLDAVLSAYRAIRSSTPISRAVTSLHYSRRWQWATAAATVADWTDDPDRPQRLLAGEPVLSRTVELHATPGRCSYRCAMCLWSDQDQLTYGKRDLRVDGLLSTDDWRRVLDELHAGGARRVVFSGGGEALLNRDLPVLLRHAWDLRMRAQLYTTGYHLQPDQDDLWTELLRLERIRFSIHSPFPATYDAITGLPARLGALDRVTANLRTLAALRRDGSQVGIGFVVQPANVREIRAMAEYAADLDVDFLDIRKDEVDVTAAWSRQEFAVVSSQLVGVRDETTLGRYGSTAIDFSDELVAVANHERVSRERTSECLAKYFRPTISPFGIVAPCDLTAEPRFAAGDLNLGYVSRNPVGDIVDGLAQRFVPDSCTQCMPSSRTGNAVLHKLLADLRAGVPLDDQPFVFEAALTGPARLVRSGPGHAQGEIES